MLDPITKLVLDQIPEQFLTRLWARQAALYEDARQHSSETNLWSSIEIDTVWPHARRAAIEHEARLAAEEAGLRHFDQRHAGKYPYGVVRAETLALSFHHVSGPDVVVPKCVSRTQNAGINKFLDHYVSQEMLLWPVPEIERARLIYCCLLHGITIEKRAGKEYKNYFMRLAFPDSEFNSYTKNFSVADLLQQYALNRRLGQLPEAVQEDKARPVLNPKKKKEVIG